MRGRALGACQLGPLVACRLMHAAKAQAGCCAHGPQLADDRNLTNRQPTKALGGTPEKARAVVLRTYSSTLSISGRMAAIMVARPAALARLAMISLQGAEQRTDKFKTSWSCDMPAARAPHGNLLARAAASHHPQTQKTITDHRKTTESALTGPPHGRSHPHQ